jgi:CHAD domain-containing protein
MISAREWIDHLRDHALSAREGSDPEGVHQMRVAAGRLSVWLEMGGRHTLRDDLAWLRRSASGVRDLDVISERLGAGVARAESCADARPSVENTSAESIAAWRARCQGERVEAHRALRDAIESDRFGALVAALSWMPPLADEVARESLARFRARIERAGSELERSPKDLGALHRLRRAVRRLRYALEWLGEDARELKTLQEELGELNNLAMLLQHLERKDDSASTNRSPDAPHAHAESSEPRRAERKERSAKTAPGDARTEAADSNGRAPLQSTVAFEIDRRRTRFLADWSRSRPQVDG